MAIFTYDGKILTVGTAGIATNSDCCCGGAACPTDCGGQCDYLGTLSGITGGCAASDDEMERDYSLIRSGCTWSADDGSQYNASITLSCATGTWNLSIYINAYASGTCNYSGYLTGSITAKDDPTGTYNLSGTLSGNIGGGSASLPMTATFVISGSLEPSMVLTILDADYAGASITWCGKTWTQADVQNGVSNTVCPSAYELKDGTYTLPADKRHIEKWQGTTGINLTLSRFADKSVTTAFRYWQKKYIRLGTLGGAIGLKRDIWKSYIYPPTYSTTSSLCDMSISCGANNTSYSDFRILDGMFGSYTISGVLYTWAKGIGW